MTADISNGGQGITEAMSKLRTTDGEEAKEVANGDHSDETMISAGKFTLQQMTKQGKGKTHPLDWGYPGELTKEEATVFARFRDEVEKRGGFTVPRPLDGEECRAFLVAKCTELELGAEPAGPSYSS